jgi:hypothetical protein
MRGLRRLHEGAVDFHRHASVQHVDRDHQQAFGRVGANQETLDVCQRTARDPDPLSGGQERMREDRQVGAKRLLDCCNIRIRTRSNCEQLVHEALRAKGFEVFLPKVGVWSRRAGRRQLAPAPIFPSYFLRRAMEKKSYVEVSKARAVG